MADHSIKSDDGLLPWEERFAAGIAQGLTLAKSYIKAKQLKIAIKGSMYERISQLAQRPEIVERVKALLREAKIHDLDSIGQFHRDLSRQIEKAEACENWTACAALMRLRGQTIDALTEKKVLRVEQAASDADLVAALSGGDTQKAATLRSILGEGEDYVQ